MEITRTKDIGTIHTEIEKLKSILKEVEEFDLSFTPEEFVKSFPEVVGKDIALDYTCGYYHDMKNNLKCPTIIYFSEPHGLKDEDGKALLPNIPYWFNKQTNKDYIVCSEWRVSATGHCSIGICTLTGIREPIDIGLNKTSDWAWIAQKRKFYVYDGLSNCALVGKDIVNTGIYTKVVDYGWTSKGPSTYEICLKTTFDDIWIVRPTPYNIIKIRTLQSYYNEWVTRNKRVEEIEDLTHELTLIKAKVLSIDINPIIKNMQYIQNELDTVKKCYKESIDTNNRYILLLVTICAFVLLCHICL